MRTSALLKLHQRQIDILDMIISCDNYISRKKQDLKPLKASNDYYAGIWTRHELVDEFEAKISKYEAIKQRLIHYYLDVNQRIANMQVELYKQINTEIQLYVLS